MKYPLDKQNPPTVLYHAVSSYQLLEVLLHRLLFHEKEKAVLLLPDFIVEKYPQYRKLETRRLFDEVILFPYLHIPHREEERVLEDVARCYQQRVPYDITGFSLHLFRGCGRNAQPVAGARRGPFPHLPNPCRPC